MTATTVSRASLPRGAGRDAAATARPPAVVPARETAGVGAQLTPAPATRRVPAVVPLALLLAVHAATLTAAVVAAYPTS